MSTLSIQTAFERVTIFPSRKLVYEPHWQGAQSSRSNCYAYALNRPDLGERTPGDLNKERGAWLHRPPVESAAEWLKTALIKDGLEPASAEQAEKTAGHFIAAFGLKYFFDFHFFRRNDNGTWSYQDGPQRPQNRTLNNRPIMCAHLNDIMPNHVFSGYFKIPEKGVPAIIYEY